MSRPAQTGAGPVDVLAVMDREIDRAGRETYSAGRELIAARAAVAELVEAARNVVSADDLHAAVAALETALAKFGGAS